MPRVFEESAGGIVYRKRSGRIQVLVLKWRNSANNIVYTLPKGHIHEGESPTQAAIREINEETGLSPKFLDIKKFIKKISFSFTARHKEGSPTVDKDVHLFLVEYTGTKEPKVQKKERFVGYDWVDPKRLKNLRMKPRIYRIVKENLGFM